MTPRLRRPPTGQWGEGHVGGSGGGKDRTEGTVGQEAGQGGEVQGTQEGRVGDRTWEEKVSAWWGQVI